MPARRGFSLIIAMKASANAAPPAVSEGAAEFLDQPPRSSRRGPRSAGSGSLAPAAAPPCPSAAAPEAPGGGRRRSLRELEVEEHRLRLLVLRGRGQHVVGQPAAVSVIATSIATTNSSESSAARIFRLSASEWTGLALSMSIARKRFGWSPRTSSAIRFAGNEPGDDRRAGSPGVSRGPEDRARR